MKIRIIAVGKIKEKYIRDGVKEYIKRLSRYCSIEIIEVEDERTSANLTDREMNIIKGIEGKRVLSKIPPNSYIIPLVIEGKQMSSEELAGKMEDFMINGINDLTFIIGGSLGLSDDVIARSHFKLSFSKMTFPHQMMRMILLEQVYRGFRIIRGEPYHK